VAAIVRIDHMVTAFDPEGVLQYSRPAALRLHFGDYLQQPWLANVIAEMETKINLSADHHPRLEDL
jgi:hypothetical protein